MNKEQIYLNLIVGLQEELKNLAEDENMPRDVKMQRYLWAMVQSIDHDLDEINKEVEE